MISTAYASTASVTTDPTVVWYTALVAMTPRTATVLGAEWEWTKKSFVAPNYRMCLNEHSGILRDTLDLQPTTSTTRALGT